MITYEQIVAANEGLNSITMKDKQYIQVPERVKAFRRLFPEGFIITDLLSNEGGICFMQSKVGYYDGDRQVVLGTGFAYEKETNGYVNKTSYIENCETSAVGRALGFLALGIDGGGICSAEELAAAVMNQNKQEQKSSKVKPTDAPSSPEPVNNVIDLTDIRSKIEAAIKIWTKDMDRAGKVRFLNEVVQPALDGERNWRLCQDASLLQKLLTAVEAKAT